MTSYSKNSSFHHIQQNRIPVIHFHLETAHKKKMMILFNTLTSGHVMLRVLRDAKSGCTFYFTSACQ